MALLLGDEAVQGVFPSDLTNTQTSVLSYTHATVIGDALEIQDGEIIKTVLRSVPSLNRYHNMDYIPNPFPSSVSVVVLMKMKGK